MNLEFSSCTKLFLQCWRGRFELNGVFFRDQRGQVRSAVGCVVSVLVLSLALAVPTPAGASSPVWTQLGEDIDGPGAGYQSGWAVAISRDGSRLAEGAPWANTSGVVRVYSWDSVAGDWQLDSQIVGDGSGNLFGYSVALSQDGSRLAVGAPANDDGGGDSGQVRVYSWTGANWNQLGADINGENVGDESGRAIALSSDGSRVAVGARQNDGGGVDSGHVRVFQYNGFPFFDWLQVGQDIDGGAAGDESGKAVSLSSDGMVLAVGAPYNDDNGISSGVVRVYGYLSPNWFQVGQAIPGEAAYDWMGWSVALAADGGRLAVGAPYNGGGGTFSGHVQVYSWNDPGGWIQVGNDIDGEAGADFSGWSVALSAGGSEVAIGAPDNDGGGDKAGQVRLFTDEASGWVQVGQDIDGEALRDSSGSAVALDGDGSRVAVGAPSNDGGGVDSGHVRVFSTEIFADGFESGTLSAWSATN